MLARLLVHGLKAKLMKQYSVSQTLHDCIEEASVAVIHHWEGYFGEWLCVLPLNLHFFSFFVTQLLKSTSITSFWQGTHWRRGLASVFGLWDWESAIVWGLIVLRPTKVRSLVSFVHWLMPKLFRAKVTQRTIVSLTTEYLFGAKLTFPLISSGHFNFSIIFI